LIDDAGIAEHALQGRDAPLDEGLLVLGVIVLGVFRDIAELQRLLDAGGDLPPLDGLQGLQLFFQLPQAFTGEEDFLFPFQMQPSSPTPFFGSASPMDPQDRTEIRARLYPIEGAL